MLVSYEDAVLETRPFTFVPLGDNNVEIYDASRRGRTGTHSVQRGMTPGPYTVRRSSRLAPATTATVTDNAVMNISNTLACWAKAGPGSGSTQELFSRAYRYVLNYWQYTSAGLITCYWGQNNLGEALTTSGNRLWNDNCWHLWHWVRDQSVSPVRLSVFMDGALDGTKTETGVTPLADTSPISFRAVTVETQFAGAAYWDRALSRAEIRRMYLAAIGSLQA